MRRFSDTNQYSWLDDPTPDTGRKPKRRRGSKSVLAYVEDRPASKDAHSFDVQTLSRTNPPEEVAVATLSGPRQSVFPPSVGSTRGIYARTRTQIIDPEFLTVQQVAHRLMLSVPTIWRWTRERPDFPKPVRFSAGATRWRISDIIAFETLCGRQ